MIIHSYLYCEESLLHTTQSTKVTCIYCFKDSLSPIICENDYHVCDSCAVKESIAKISTIILQLQDKNHLDIAEKLIERCGLAGNSPHVLTLASYLTVYKNLTQKLTCKEVIEGIKRAEKIPGGRCGYYGCCGAAIAIGTAFSVLLKATPLNDKERSIANRATAESLFCISEQGGSRCCSASIRRALESSITVSADLLQVQFPSRQRRLVSCK